MVRVLLQVGCDSPVEDASASRAGWGAALDAPSPEIPRDGALPTLLPRDAAEASSAIHPDTPDGSAMIDVGMPDGSDASCTLDPATGALVLSESEFCDLPEAPCERDVARLRAKLPDCSIESGSPWTRTVGCGVESIGFSGGYTGATNYFDEATGEWIGAEAFTDVSHGPCDPGLWRTGRLRPPCPEEVTAHCRRADGGTEGGLADSAP